ncbi:aldo/keto reductase [Candidatus Saccharibacteria bacterium]|nr:aldo/keto reductase [Candidatus Saccharibacteria bacterium]
MNIPNLKMNNEQKIPQVGLGLWMNKDGEACRQSVKFALEAGYRHFDSAQAYDNEQFLGEAIKKGGVPREELFITTKILNDNQWWNDIIPSFEKSLENLQTDYVDLLLLHFPVTETRRPAWRRMEEIYKSGRAKSIGVSNYMIHHLEELLKEGDIKPAVNQVELHVFLQQPELVKFCQKNDIVVEAYSPLAHGNGMDDPVLASIAKKHGKSTAQIMIRWCIEMGTVPLPKSTHQGRIKENIDIFNFKLDKQDMADIAKLDRDFRTCWDPTHVP